MLRFLQEPYLLNQGDLIVAVISSTNAVGESLPSVPNTVG